MNVPFTPPLTAPHNTNQPYRVHRCTQCNTPYPYNPFETSITTDQSGRKTWNIGMVGSPFRYTRGIAADMLRRSACFVRFRQRVKRYGITMPTRS